MALLDGLIRYLRYKQAISLVDTLREQLEIKSVLDIGSGDGSFSELLKLRGFNVKTLDKQGGDFLYDLEKPLPFKDKEFDLTVALAVIEHINNYSLLLNEMKRISRSVILTTPSPKAKLILDTLAKMRVINREHILDHKIYIKKRELESFGFTVYPFEMGLNYLGVWIEWIS